MRKLAVAWGGLARLGRVAASSWAGVTVSCAHVSWAGMLFSAHGRHRTSFRCCGLTHPPIV